MALLWICAPAVKAATPVPAEGKVVWTHRPGMAHAQAGQLDWFTPRNTDAEGCRALLAEAIATLTGEIDEQEAWKALFHDCNLRMGRGWRGYVDGEKIVIKVDNDNSTSQYNSGSINVTPVLVAQVVRSLVDAGVPGRCITIASPSGYITDALYETVSDACPGVTFIDVTGRCGRRKAEYERHSIRWAKPSESPGTGLLKDVVEAAYTLNIAMLKGNGNLCANNWLGMAERHSSAKRYGFAPLVDLTGHADVGAKCLLYVIDAIYGSRSGEGKLGTTWRSAPFNGTYPQSLLASVDPVAIETVALDLLEKEYGERPDDTYLQEAAHADRPPSGLHYAPAGIRLTSLGKAERDTNSPRHAYVNIQLAYRPIR